MFAQSLFKIKKNVRDKYNYNDACPHVPKIFSAYNDGFCYINLKDSVNPK